MKPASAERASRETVAGSQDAERRRQQVRKLLGPDHSDRDVADRLNLPRSTVHLDATASAARLLDVDDGRITAKEASERYGLKLATLCARIRAGAIPGAEQVRPRRYRVDPIQLETYLATRPRCEYEGCDKLARIGSRACCGPHARAIEMDGTKKPYETTRRMAAAKQAWWDDDDLGLKRRAVGDRVAAMHADPETHQHFRLRLAEGRRLTPATIAKRQRALDGVQGARRAGRGGGRRAIWETQPEMVNHLYELKRANPAWGRIRLANATGLTEEEVRSALGHLPGG
jgi:hypothetical protein